MSSGGCWPKAPPEYTSTGAGADKVMSGSPPPAGTGPESGSAAEAHRIFVEAAQAVYPIDPAGAFGIGVAAAVMRTFGADSGTPLPVTDALVVPVAGDPPRTLCLRHMLVAMTQVAEGDWYGAVTALDRALELGDRVDDRDVLWNLANAALHLGADRAQQHFYGCALSRAREAGAVTAVVYCLQRLCYGQYLGGDLVAVRNSDLA